MQFATIRPANGRVHLYAFEKEYNRTVDIGYRLIQQKDVEEELKKFDFVDLVLPAQDVFYYIKKYPPIGKSQLDKIISQEMTLETPFTPDEMLIVHTQEDIENGKTLVMSVKKEKIHTIIASLGGEIKEKIRMIIPEQLLLFNSQDVDKTVFIGSSSISIAEKNGQFILSGGIEQLHTDLRLQFPDMEDDDYTIWLETLGDISDLQELNPDEIRARNFFEKWLKRVVASVKPWVADSATITWVFSDTLPGNGESILQDALEQEKVDYEYDMVLASSLLQQLGTAGTKNRLLNFAKGEFTYRGGMQFLKIRLFAALIIFAVLLITTVLAMQIRLSSLNELSDSIDKKNKKITKEILGKEYPSLRQAVSVMNKTISGGNAKKSKNLHPYTAIATMEVLFPLIAFPESTIEIKDFSVKDGGKIRLTGESDSLDDINKMVENIEALEQVGEVNKGQINSRKGKNRFNIHFEYLPKQPEILKKSTKKEKKKAKGGDK